MAKYGYIVENDLMASKIDTLVRTAKCSTDVDGGNLVTVAGYKDGVYTATLGKADSGLGCWMAYNPSVRYTKVGDLTIAAVSADPRDYTNLKEYPIDIFKPQVEDIITFTAPNITGTAPTANQFLEPDANGKLKMVATQTADKTSFSVLEVKTMSFPKAGIGMEYAKIYVCKCVAN